MITTHDLLIEKCKFKQPIYVKLDDFITVDIRENVTDMLLQLSSTMKAVNVHNIMDSIDNDSYDSYIIELKLPNTLEIYGMKQYEGCIYCDGTGEDEYRECDNCGHRHNCVCEWCDGKKYTRIGKPAERILVKVFNLTQVEMDI